MFIHAIFVSLFVSFYNLLMTFYVLLLLTSPTGAVAKYCDEYVCVYVSLSVR